MKTARSIFRSEAREPIRTLRIVPRYELPKKRLHWFNSALGLFSIIMAIAAILIVVMEIILGKLI